MMLHEALQGSSADKGADSLHSHMRARNRLARVPRWVWTMLCNLCPLYACVDTLLHAHMHAHTHTSHKTYANASAAHLGILLPKVGPAALAAAARGLVRLLQGWSGVRARHNGHWHRHGWGWV